MALTEAGRADHGVILVCAPAGYGKTVLLADWAERALRAGRHIAWVTVDKDDNDPFVFWSAILRSLETSGSRGDPDGPGQPGLQRLSPPQQGFERGFVAAVVEVLDALSDPLILILDDVHELRDPACLDGLGLLLRMRPGQLQLVLAARADPPLGLHRLRIGGELAELRTNDLAFTAEEAAQLLAEHQVRLDDPDLLGLLDRTEGWAAGLRIAAAALTGSNAPAEVIGGFRGDERPLADYLAAEVLGGQPPDVQQFLFSTCAPDELTPGLARRLSARADAGHVLDELEHANALIVRLGRTGDWYRYHALLRGYLRAEAARRDPDALRAQHAATAGWLAGYGAPAQALDHAAAAEDPALLAGLVNQHGLRLILSGQGPALRRAVPAQHDAARDPAVAALLAIAALDAGDAPAADQSLPRLTRASFDAAGERERALHAIAWLGRALLGGDVPAGLDLIASTPAGSSGDLDLDLLALATRGPARLRVGDYRGAVADYERALALARQAGHDQLVLTLLSRLAGATGALTEFPEMHRWSAEAIKFAASRGWAQSPRVAYAYLIAAWTGFQTGDDEAVRRWSPLALEVVEGVPDLEIELGVRSMAALADFEAGHQRRAAYEQMRSQWRNPQAAQVSPALIGFAAPQEMRMALTLGEYTAAGEVADRVAGILGDCAETRTLRATLHERLRRRSAARRLIAPVLSGERVVHVQSTLAAAWLLEASIAGAEGETARAHEALERALAWAAPNQATRLFSDAPANIRSLLAADVSRFGQWDTFAEKLLATLPPDSQHRAAPGQAAPAETLTARELELLRDLPSLLSVEQIAAARSISANTAKSHLRALYRKLGVSSRRDAVTQARRLGLI
jgi:LuxR family maltose regulon positive regulatory protein